MQPAQWFINGRFLSQPATGVQRYAEEIVRALDEVLAEQDGPRARLKAELLCPPGSRELPGLKTISCRWVGHGTGHVWSKPAFRCSSRAALSALETQSSCFVETDIVYSRCEPKTFSTELFESVPYLIPRASSRARAQRRRRRYGVPLFGVAASALRDRASLEDTRDAEWIRAYPPMETPAFEHHQGCGRAGDGCSDRQPGAA